MDTSTRYVPYAGELDAPSPSPTPFRNWWNQDTQAAAAASEPPQSRTGYLPGEPIASRGGLSTFTIDNATNNKDAIVRLYLDGKRPAVRSMHVRQGEKFTAENLREGVYRLRYRFSESDDTFEAGQVFVLREIESDNGRSFSRMTVTLFEVANGNLKMNKVASSDF